MPSEVIFRMETVYSFLLVLTRIAGSFVFVPLPGVRHGQDAPKVVLAFAVTFLLMPFWPSPPSRSPGAFQLAGWLLREAVLGIAIGLIVGAVLETFTLAAQILGLQAGYSYASTIDPQSQADTTVLQLFMQLFAGLLFFACGADHLLMRAYAATFTSIPLGSFSPGPSLATEITTLGGAMLATGLRLAMPLVAILLLIDVTLALLGRLNAQLQLISIALPAKMAVASIVLAALAAGSPAIFERTVSSSFRALTHLGK